MNNLLDSLIQPAFAQAAPEATQGSGYSFIVMTAVLLVFMYFMIWRPQAKRAREQQNLLNGLSVGEEVILAGGLLGRIEKLDNQYLKLTIANNVAILVQKSAVVSVLPKGTIKSIE